MTNRLIPTLALSAFCGLLVGCGLDSPEAQTTEPKKASPEKWHWPKVVVSKETTYFTEPLLPDGGVDYVAAINRRCSEGVTPENNAAVALWQAAGPAELDKKIRARYFKRLGIPELPEKGEYFAYFYDFSEYLAVEKRPDKEAKFSRKAWDDYNLISGMPWSREDYPLWAAVLKRNEKTLDLLVDGLQRPKFYLPLVPYREDCPMITATCFLSGNSEARSAARLLKLRAMSRLHDGEIPGAWRDIMALHRLARFMSHQPLMTCWFTGIGLDGMAHHAAVMLSQSDKLSAEQCKEIQKQLENLPPLGALKDISNEAERCSSLEALVLLADATSVDGYFKIYERYVHLKKIDKNQEPSRQQKAFTRLAEGSNVDWSEVWRRHNVFWDRLTKALDFPRDTDSIAMLEDLESEIANRSQKTADATLALDDDAIKNMDPKQRAKSIAEVTILPGLLNVWKTTVGIAQKCQAQDNMTLLAFALAGYRADHHGEYPNTLSELTPDYIDAIPKDPFIHADLKYRQVSDGYVVYSVGINRKDEGGFGVGHMPEFATDKEKQTWDDISIHTPANESY